MAVSGVIGWLNIRSLGVDLQVPDELYRSIPTQLAVRLTNRRRLLPSFLLEVVLCGETVSVPFLLRGESLTRQMRHTFAERGVAHIGPAVIVSPFPVNFFVRATTVPLDRQALVFPAPRRLPLPGRSPRTPRQGEASALQRGADGETAAIADYSGREPLKLIHWRLSARHAELKVKLAATPAGEPLVIDLADLPGNLEERLAGATYLINRLIRQGRPVDLVLAKRRLAPAATRRHRLQLLGELAVYGQD